MISIKEECLSEAIFLDKKIEGCELAVTDKAKCVMCRKRIAKGIPRLYVFGELRQPPPDEGIIKIKRFLCYKCSERLVVSKKDDYMQTIKEGEEAKQKLLKLNKITERLSGLLKNKDIIKKIQTEEIIQELEHEEEGCEWDNTW